MAQILNGIEKKKTEKYAWKGILFIFTALKCRQSISVLVVHGLYLDQCDQIMD